MGIDATQKLPPRRRHSYFEIQAGRSNYPTHIDGRRQIVLVLLKDISERDRNGTVGHRPRIAFIDDFLSDV